LFGSSRRIRWLGGREEVRERRLDLEGFRGEVEERQWWRQVEMVWLLWYRREDEEGSD